MDSKVVNREIRGRIWPQLKEAGFQSTTPRSAWRHEADRIDVVNFQSFNSYNARVIGVTTFSFAVNLGTFLRYVPPQWPVKKVKGGAPFPEECECTFRGRLRPSIPQSHENDSVWGIDERGSNLSWSITDIANQVPAALDWFDRLRDRKEVLRILLEDEISMTELWGFGRLSSPIRSYLTGYAALANNENSLADSYLIAAIDSGRFVSLFSSLEEARSRSTLAASNTLDQHASR